MGKAKLPTRGSAAERTRTKLNALVQMLARHWRAFWDRGAVMHGTEIVDDQDNVSRAEKRRHFWAELRAGQLEAEARRSK